MKKTAFIYSRVSTDTQETERQARELKDYCKNNGYNVVGAIEETISGTKKIKSRKHLIEQVIKSKAKYFIFDDYSRLSRNVKTALEIKDQLHKAGVCLIAIKTGLKSLNDKGEVDTTAQMIFTSLISVYEFENETRKQQIKSGLANARAKGITLGRPEGTGEDLVKKYPKIVKYLSTNSIRETARLAIRSKSLVQRVKKQMQELEESVKELEKEIERE